MSAVRIYVQGNKGAHVFETESEAPLYQSELYGKVRSDILVLLESELHVYGQPETQATKAGTYEIRFDTGVLSVSDSNGDLIRAYGVGMWQQVYRHPHRQ